MRLALRYTLGMPGILMHLVAATLYLGLAALLWRTRWNGRQTQSVPAGLRSHERGLLLGTLALHGVALRYAVFDGDTMRFGFAIALSFMMWLAIALYWIESFYARIEGLLIIGLPAAAAAALLAGLVTQHHVLANA